MKKLIFILAALVATSVAFAQQPKAKKAPGQNNRSYLSIDEKAEKISQRLKTELALSDDQTSQVKAITLNREKQLSEAKTKSGQDKKAFGKLRKPIIDSWETELKSILTPEQYTTFLAKKEERKKAREAKKSAKTSGSETIEEDELD